MDVLTLSLAVQKALAAMGVKIEPGKTILGPMTIALDSDNQMIIPQTLDVEDGCEYEIVATWGDMAGSTMVTAQPYVENDVKIGHLLLVDDGDQDDLVIVALTAEAAEAQGVGGLLQIVEDTGTVELDWNGVIIEIRKPETIHPIDPKFIPGAVLPVVELSSINLDDTSAPLSESDGAKLDALAGMPFVFLLRDAGANMYVVMSGIHYPGGEADAFTVYSGFMSSAIFGDTKVQLHKFNGNWLFSHETEGAPE